MADKRISRRTLAGAAALLPALMIRNVASAETNQERQQKIDLALGYIDRIEKKGEFGSIAQFISPDYASPEAGNAPGIDALSTRISRWRDYLMGIMPDQHYEIVDSMASGDRVSVASYLKGTSTAGRLVVVPAVWWFALKEDLITSIYYGMDTQELLAQALG